jgi:hypothetical protein
MDHPLVRALTIASILGCAGLSVMAEQYARRDLAYARWASTQPDSTMRASAAYHAANSQRLLDARWSLRGHGTLGVLGVVAGGTALAASLSMRRRRREGPSQAGSR